MPQKLLKFTLLLLVAGLVSYLFYLNPASVEVHLSTTQSWSAPLAFVLILSFAGGAILAALFATVFGIWHLFGDWQTKRVYARQAHEQSALLEAREKLAVRDFTQARRALRKVLAANPKNHQARSLLIDLEIECGDAEMARSLLDEARSDLQYSPELLVRSAEVYEALGNMLSAYDSFGAIHSRDPENTFALSKMISILETLNRFDEAAKLQETLLRKLPKSELPAAQKRLLRLELRALGREKLSPDEERRQLEELGRRHKHSPEILLRQAELERDGGNLAGAGKKLVQAFQDSGDLHLLFLLARNWLKVSEPDKAIKQVTAALAVKDETLSSRGRLALISLMLALGMHGDARKEFDKIAGFLPSSMEERALKNYLAASMELGTAASSAGVLMLVDALSDASPLITAARNLNTAGSARGENSESWQEQFLLRASNSPSPMLSTP